MMKPLTLADLPGPRGLPLLGNTLQLHPARLHLILEAWADRYGARYRFRMGTQSIVVLSEPGEVLDILRDRPDTFRRLSAIESVNRELGINGLFSAEGETWRRHRELVMQGFDRTQLRRFFPTLAGIAERLVKRWRQPAGTGEPFDGRVDLMRYTVDVTTNFVFGCDLNTLERGSDTLQSHIEKFLPMINRRVSAPFPYWRYWKGRADRELDRSVGAVRAACAGFIAQSRSRLAERAAESAGQNVQPSNLLEGFVAAQAGGIGIGEPEIIGNAIVMLLAGEDTSAHTLAWIIDYLCRFPEVQEKLQAEIDAFPDITEPQELERLVYLDGIMQETMRLKSVAPLLFLEANRESLVGGLRIPQGTGLMVLLRYPCLRERQFSHAGEFRPERWLQPRDLVTFPVHNRQTLIPFGAGPRFCPGRHLAWIEIKMAMAALCRQFELGYAEGVEPPAECFEFTMTPSHLRIRLVPRP